MSHRLDRRSFLRIVAAAGGLGVAAPLLARLPVLGQGASPGPLTIDDLAASLDYDVQQIFDAVAAIGYDAYPGVLRGANGTLRGGRGNAADQAVLLGALLDAALVKYRYVIGSIDPTTFDQQLASRPRDAAAARAERSSVVLPPDVIAAWGDAAAWPRDADIDAIYADAQDWVASTTDMLHSTLTDAGITPTVPAQTGDVERDQHVWIQYQDGANWVDLDPSVPGAVAGTAYGTPNQRVDTLPDELFHTITLRVATEVVQGGVPTRVVPLTTQFRAADVEGSPILLSHAPAAWLDIGGALTGEQRYVPIVQIGDSTTRGDQVVLAGGGGVLDALGAPGDPEGQTLAEWLEFDIDVPGTPTTTATRQLFDRLTPEQRASGDLQLDSLPPVTVTHIDDEVGDMFLPFATTEILSVSGHAQPWTVFDAPTVAMPDTAEAFQGIATQGAFALDHMRDLLELQLTDRLGACSWAGRPQVTWMQLAPQAGSGSGPATVRTRVDIIDHARIPGTLDGFPAERAGILAGVIEHAAERMLVAASTAYLAPGARPVELSVARVFEEAAAEGLQPIVLSPGSEPTIDGASPAALDRIRAAQATGRTIVVPPRAVTIDGSPRLGWWEYDPATGLVSDRYEDGGGAELSEEAVLIIRIATGAACAFAVLGSIAFVTKAAQGKLNSFTDFTDGVASTGGGIAGCAAGGFALP